MNDREKFNLAYHESSHAVVGCVLGREVEYVTIIPAEGEAARGKVKFVPEDVTEANHIAVVKRALVYKLAGFIGALTCCGESDPNISDEDFWRHTDTQLQVAGFGREDGETGDSGDIKELLQILQQSEQDFESCKREIAGKTIELTYQYWSAIKALAEALLVHGKLTGEQVNPLLQPFGIVARRGPAVSYGELYR